MLSLLFIKKSLWNVWVFIFDDVRVNKSRVNLYMICIVIIIESKESRVIGLD